LLTRALAGVRYNALMNKIGVLTSGGDAPGMNAAIRSVVRTAVVRGWQVLGINRGYAGLISGDMIPLGNRDVSGIMQRGGTMLGSARCPEFKSVDVQRIGLERLASRGVEGLVVIGGNGSQTGAHALYNLGLPVVGVASTIDNDLYGSAITLGVDTALNIALEAIDRLKVTASSHHRAFLVEVMGRDCGYLALMAGLAGGAELVIIPEHDIEVSAVEQELEMAYARGKKHAIVVIAEGAKLKAQQLALHFEASRDKRNFDLRVTTLGHVQRGGTPGAFDRLLGTRLGAAAVDCLAEGNSGVLVGIAQGDGLIHTPLEEVVTHKKPLELELYELANILAR